MSFARLHQVVTYLVSGLGLVALTLGPELGLVAQIALALGWLTSMFVPQHVIARADWSRGWTIVVIAFFALEVLRGLAGEPLLELGLEYAGVLQISRLFNRRTARDHEHIAVLAFLHLVAATILSTGLGYAFVFLGFVITTPWMLALTHLRREIEGNYPGPEEGEGRADVRRVLASRRVVGTGFLVGTALLALPLFFTTAAVFLVFPRVGLGFLSFGHGEGRRVAGFGRNVELGGFGVIRDDPTVVLRVKLAGLGEEPPERIGLRLRGTSFDAYDGRRWTRSSSKSNPLARMDDYFVLGRWPHAGDVEMEILLDQLDEPVVFLPAGTVGLTVPPRLRAGREEPRRLLLGDGLDVRYADDDALGLLYTAHADPRARRVEEPLTPEDRRRYVAVPDGYERIAALAQQITGEATGDAARAERILAHLRDSGRYVYSLEQPNTRGRDPLHVFLFDARSGHCEYFSTAMAMLLRASGIPARNVTGFVGGQYNRYGRYYAVRQGDAHSWVEAWIDGGWVTFDPTPAASAAAFVDDGVLGSMRALVDALRAQWSTHVVGYDLRVQASALAGIVEWIADLRAERRGIEPPSSAGESARSRGVSWLVWLAAAAVLAALALLAVRALRRRATGGAAEATEAREAVRLYRELERALARRGRPRPSSRTPREHARVLAEEGFEGADVVQEITNAYLLARFGGRGLDPRVLTRLKSGIDTVRAPRGPGRQSVPR